MVITVVVVVGVNLVEIVTPQVEGDVRFHADVSHVAPCRYRRPWLWVVAIEISHSARKRETAHSNWKDAGPTTRVVLVVSEGDVENSREK